MYTRTNCTCASCARYIILVPSMNGLYLCGVQYWTTVVIFCQSIYYIREKTYLYSIWFNQMSWFLISSTLVLQLLGGAMWILFNCSLIIGFTDFSGFLFSFASKNGAAPLFGHIWFLGQAHSSWDSSYEILVFVFVFVFVFCFYSFSVLRPE